jgi:hypothetical protein
MKKLSLIIILLLHLTSFSQNENGELKVEGQMKSGKPTVYLEYVCQDKKKVFLRMYNNTIWAIAVSSDELYYRTKKTVKLSNGKEFYVIPNDKEISLQFKVDKFELPSKNVKLPKIVRNDTSFTNWIASDDSVLFSVPVEYLKEDLMISVSFNYEWEVSKKGIILSGPEHRVLFRGIDVPDKTLPCEK